MPAPQSLPVLLHRPFGLSLARSFNAARMASAALKACALSLAMLLCATSAVAQSEGVIYTFGTAPQYSQNGDMPRANLIQASDQQIYGTTFSGGGRGGIDAFGVLFRLNIDATFTVLHSFVAADGEYPAAGVIQGTDGNLYGTTSSGTVSTAGGTAANNGSVFEYNLSTSTFSVLHTFSATGSDGANPQSGVIQGTDGNLYGTTYDGGTHNMGTVYQITLPAGVYTTLYSFTGGSDGSRISAGLVQGLADSLFYGMATVDTNATGPGLIFKVSGTGQFTKVYEFGTGSGDIGKRPVAALTQGTDGNFYGTTTNSTSSQPGQGTVFRVSSAGVYTLLHAFASNAEGNDSLASLFLASDGLFYGTTATGGANNLGTIFTVDSSGNFNIAYNFGAASNDAEAPFAGLIQTQAGQFLGTTEDGGTNAGGTIFGLTYSQGEPGPVYLSTNYPAFGVPTVAAGTKGSLSYFVRNGTSATMQQCFATNTAGDPGWMGVVTGSSTSIKSAPITPYKTGTVNYTLTCGGVETAYTVINVTAATPSVSVGSINTVVGSMSQMSLSVAESGNAGSTSGSQVNFSVPSSAYGSFFPTSCTINSAGTCSVLYIPSGTLAVGTYANAIQASFSSVSPYANATATGNLTVTTGSATQTINFPQPSPGVANGSATISATTTSGLPVAFSIISGPATLSATTLSGSGSSAVSTATITYSATGTVVIQADQAGNGTYAAAPSVQQSVTVNPNFVWVVNNSSTVTRLTNTGSVTATAGAAHGASSQGGIAFDAAGNSWSVASGPNQLQSTSAADTAPAIYIGGGIGKPVALQLDGAGYIWVANASNNTVSVFNNAGTPVTGMRGYNAFASQSRSTGNPSSLAIDSSGGVWITNQTNDSVTHIIGAAAPVTTPLVNAVRSATVGTKP